MRFFIIAKAIAFVLAALFFVPLIAYESNKAILSLIAPMVYLDVHAMTPVVKQGGDLELSFTFDRRRFCRTTLNRYITVRQTQHVVWRETIVGGVANTPGRHTVIGDVRLPPELRPGQYEYLTITFFECIEGLHHATHPPVPFEVVP